MIQRMAVGRGVQSNPIRHTGTAEEIPDHVVVGLIIAVEVVQINARIRRIRRGTIMNPVVGDAGAIAIRANTIIKTGIYDAQIFAENPRTIEIIEQN